MLALNEADWAWIGTHFGLRLKVHQLLKQYHRDGDRARFVELALGESDPLGNLSAHELGLAPLVRQNKDAAKRVYELAGRILAVNRADELPPLIASASLDYLKISVGSEMACMLRPSICWVANTKSLWSYLIDDCNGNAAQATKLMNAYNEVGMATIYTHMQNAMILASERQPEHGSPALASVRAYRFLWADAICARVYDEKY